jgi:hypothetical protein
MTPKCVEEVHELEMNNDVFADMSVEQLLYAAIIGTSYEDVVWTLVSTYWHKLCPNVKNGM